MEHHVVTKTEAACRQVREAVLLYFEERDPIAIHTIVASAHQVLIDIGKRAGVQSIVKNPSALEGQDVQSFLRLVNYPYNFFKHADRDPDGLIDVGPLLSFTADFIMDAIVMLQNLTGSIPLEAKVFWAWFVSLHHDQFDNLPKDGEIARLQSMGLGEWPLPKIHSFLAFSKIAEDAGA